MESKQADITSLLQQWSGGNEEALDDVLSICWGDLERIARKRLSQERPDHTLDTCGMISEAFLRLRTCSQISWQHRSQFFGLVAEIMRRILVDHARARLTHKRGGEFAVFSLCDLQQSLRVPAPDPIDVLGLHIGLDKLQRFDDSLAQVVKLRFFLGLTANEVATILSCSPTTIKRKWTFARRWLAREFATMDLQRINEA